MQFLSARASTNLGFLRNSNNNVPLKALVINHNNLFAKNPMLQKMKTADLTRKEFLFTLAQNSLFLPNFQNMLLVNIAQFRKMADWQLAETIESNLRDERGENQVGSININEAHETWHRDFLNALGMTNNQIDSSPILPTTREANERMLALEKSRSALALAGGLLFIEGVIPLEFKSIKISMEKIFPYLFVITKNDSVDQQRKKQRALRYIDDHISHDGQRHFPDLLAALQKYESNPNQYEALKYGIQVAAEAMDGMYSGILNFLYK